MNAYSLTLVCLVGLFHLFYAVAIWRKDFSVIDICWGLGHLIPLYFSLTFSSHIELRQIFVSAIVFPWALRLSMYIQYRSIGKGEDHRYKKMREGYGEKANIKAYVNIFWLQTILLYVISLPILFINLSPKSGSSYWDYIGFVISICGLLIESIADWQKHIFKKSNPNKLITTGLWKYSRHPNYFGECLVWWGVFLMSVGAQVWQLCIFSPLFLTFLLLKVSGVSMLEKSYVSREGFEEYKRKTSSFIPWFPKEQR